MESNITNQFAEEVILAEERTTDEEKAHIMEGEWVAFRITLNAVQYAYIQ